MTTQLISLSSGSLDLSVELMRRWQQNSRPNFAQFVAEFDVRATQELSALARADLQQSWAHGYSCQVEDYFSRVPQLARDPETAVDLIFAEYLIREERGDNPAAAEYQQRFPEYAAELASQIELHCALQSDDDLACETDRPRSEIAQPLFFRAQRNNGSGIAFDYAVLSEIGRGGMAVVYRARQISLNRLVALKMVRAFDCASVELLHRFRCEAETVARLHHPQIVQIFDYGEHDGSPFLALQLVEGTTLANLLNGKSRSPRQAAELIVALARTIQFAHEQGVIHRDLKPANILIPQTNTGGNAPTSFSESPISSDSRTRASNTTAIDPRLAKITDFGLAKILDAGPAQNTRTGTIMGTPAYMSPEQITGKTHQIGPASDIYALGAILYELLTGRPPFNSDSALETLRQVVSEEPVSISRLQTRVSRDLTTICSKCLRKEPWQRYGSAAALADDLQRFLDDHPIHARPINTVERAWRWCRRNPALALLSSSVAALLLTVATVSIYLTLQLRAELGRTAKAERSERQAKKLAQLRLFKSYLTEMAARSDSGRIGQRFGALDTVQKAKLVLEDVGQTPERVLELRNAAIAALSLPDLRRMRTITGWPDGAVNMAFSAAADRYVASTEPGALVVYRLSDGKELLKVEHSGTDVIPLISHDGRYVAVSDGRSSTLWQIDTPVPIMKWQENDTTNLSLSTDDRYAAVSGPGEQMRLLDLVTGGPIRRLGRGAAKSQFAFHLPSQRIAVGTLESLQIISLVTGDVLLELPPPKGFNRHYPGLSWHPSGNYLAAAGYDDGVALWDTTSGARVRTYPQHGGGVHPHFIGSGDLLLTADSWTGNLHLWQTDTGRLLISDPSFPPFVSDVTSTGEQLLLGFDVDRLVLWQLEPGQVCATLPNGLYHSMGYAHSIDISPDGRLLAIGRDQGCEVWDLLNRTRASLALSHACFSQFIADGSLVVRCDAGIFRWPRKLISSKNVLSDGGESVVEVRYGPPEKLYGPTLDPKFAISKDGARLVARGSEGWQIVESISSSKAITLGPPGDPRVVSLSASGEWVALGSWYGPGASVYSARTGVHRIDLPVGYYVAVVFSPDDRYLVTSPNGVEAWHTSDWRVGSRFHAQGTTANGLSLLFSGDGRVLALGQPSGKVRLTDPDTGNDWGTIVQPELKPAALTAFSPDQSRFVILSPGVDATTYFWNITELRRRLDELGLDWPSEVLKQRQLTDDVLTNAKSLDISFDKGSLNGSTDGESIVP